MGQSLSQTLDEMERLGYEFDFHAGGSAQVVSPLICGPDAPRLLEIEREFAAHRDAFFAEIETRLWRRHGLLPPPKGE